MQPGTPSAGPASAPVTPGSPARRDALRLVSAVLLTACGLLAACGPSAPTVADGGPPPDPYAGFAPCDPLPAPSPHEPVEGLVAPEGLVVVDVRRTGPVVAVRGFVDATPLELRDAFEGRDDVEVVHVEDEGFEVEVLVDAGEFRTFLKATIRCRTGSIVALVVARDVDAERLPRPGRGG